MRSVQFLEYEFVLSSVEEMARHVQQAVGCAWCPTDFVHSSASEITLHAQHALGGGGCRYKAVLWLQPMQPAISQHVNRTAQLPGMRAWCRRTR